MISESLKKGALVGYPSTKQLECLVAVADTCNFRSAAERLNLTQPPLSRHIKALEDLVGARLFERDTHSVVLTEAGALLAERARRILAEMNDGLDEARALGARPKERLNIGFTRVIHPLVFPNLERELAERGFQVSVTESHGTSRALIDAVKTGRLDLAVVTAQPTLPRRLVASDLFEESIVAVLSSSQTVQAGRLAFTDLPKIPLFWFRRPENPILYDAAEQAFAQHAFSPTIRPKPSHRDALYVKVASGDGVAFLPISQSFTQRSDVGYKRFVEEIEQILRLHVQVVFRRDDARPQLHEAIAILTASSERHSERVRQTLEAMQ